MKAQQKQDRNNIKDPQKKHRLETVSKNILLEGLNQFYITSLTLSSAVPYVNKNV